MLYPFMTLNDNTEIVHSEIMDIFLRESLNVFPAVFRKPAGGGIKAALNWFFDSNCRMESIPSQVSGNTGLSILQRKKLWFTIMTVIVTLVFTRLILIFRLGSIRV